MSLLGELRVVREPLVLSATARTWGARHLSCVNPNEGSAQLQVLSAVEMRKLASSAGDPPKVMNEVQYLDESSLLAFLKCYGSKV